MPQKKRSKSQESSSSASSKPKISLIGIDLAREGLEFTFVGPLVGCSECRIKNVCFNLDPGRTYRVLKVREKENPCFVFNQDRVATVEVEEVPEIAHMQYGKKIQEGSSVTLKSIDCDHFTCPNIERCNLIHVREGTRGVINKVEEKLDCPKGYDMRRVSITLQ